MTQTENGHPAHYFMTMGRSCSLLAAVLLATVVPPSASFSASPVTGHYSDDVPYREAAYDPEAASQFYHSRPIASTLRLTEIVTKTSKFVIDTLLDTSLKREDKMAEQRGRELLAMVTDLGPTAIKIGQALSARGDLLPAKYAQSLVELQDAVPPFGGALGRAVIEEELGIKIDDVFSSLSTEPVASASIGVVYKGKLRDSGIDVAVKVQRPGVLKSIALDLHTIRSLAPKWQELKEINTDLVGLVDAWGEGLMNELDYCAEAEATKEFSEAMKKRGLGSVFAPEVIDELSSTHVLTTKWVDGVRLADSDAEDVSRLCGVALNSYLTMLLDTGTLHCDPHSGNVLRTNDGRLCILDWGMVLKVPPDLQLSLLEFIANLNAKNYEDVPQDLVKLDFVPKDKLDELRESGLTVAISSMLELAGQGGGPKGAMKRLVAQNKEKYAEALAEFDDLDSKEATEARQKLFREDWQQQMAEDAMNRDGSAPTSTTVDVTVKIEQMQQENADVFAVPPYFVYMSRAFATLEGIGLSSDPDYSILQECYPYLAKRLLSDDSPRARGALRTLLYGKSDDLDLTKLQELTTGFESYTTSTSSVQSSRGESNEGRAAALEQLTNVLLSEDKNYVQDLLLREAAVALDATFRDVVTSPLAPLQNLPINPVLRPFTLPLELTKVLLELQSIDEKDERRLENVRILQKLGSGAFGSGGQDTARRASDNARDVNIGRIVEEASKRRIALARMGVRFSGKMVSIQAERLREKASAAAVNTGTTGRHNKVEVSELAQILAKQGAQQLEAVAGAIGSLDDDLGERF